MAESYLFDKRRILPVAAYLQGQYNVNDLYIGVQSVIGRNGVEKIIEFDLTSKEKEMLNSSINSVKNLVSQINL
jgi:malate dehydrogenase